MADNGLLIKISAETKEFEKGIDEVKKATASLEGQLAGIAKISGVAFAALQAGALVAIHAYGESEKASKELILSLQNQGIASDKLLKKYESLATSIQDKTGVDDDQIKSGLAVLQNFLGQEEASEGLAQAMVDLAEKTGSVESAAQILGRGIDGNVRGLKQFGIVVDESLSREERLAKITEEVSTRFGGLSESAGKGVGSVRGLQTAFGNFLEAVGQRLAPTFEKIVAGLTTFFTELERNGPLVDFIVEVGKIAAIVAGAVLALTSAGLAIIKIQQALGIAKVALEVFGLSARVAVGATGIGLILLVAGELYLNWNKIWPVMQAVFQTFSDNVSNIAGGLGLIISAVILPGPDSISRIKAGYEKLKSVVTEGITNIKKSGEEAAGDGVGIHQDPAKEAAADKLAEDHAKKEITRNERIRAERELTQLQAEDASSRLIELKKQEIETLKQLEDDKYIKQQESLTNHLALTKQLEDDARANDTAARQIFTEQLLASDAGYKNLDLVNQQVFLQKHQQQLVDATLTESTAKQKFIADELKKQIDSNNQKLLEQQKYGAAYAAINQAMNTNEVKGFSQGVSQLTALQGSKSKELKAIGKAAAVADITIKTAQSAMAAFSGFASIPIVGIPLGIAAAAAVVAFGAEQIGNVFAAKQGGVVGFDMGGSVPGFNTGGDSIPSMLQAGELVVPRSNFEETVTAVANSRASAAPEATSGVSTGAGGGGTAVAVSLQFSGDNAEKFLTARRVEARSLGTLSDSGAIA